ncbi:HpsJ-like protein, cyanoexosortase C-associated [Nodosilinea sp. AN01ver1]|uniref:HpsJ-like protein, cyanoexosortase C-associated n=1 Tax=Nodosilinea sp. AN01ver1 TaxID=3423362 RepID=UPI003D318C64
MTSIPGISVASTPNGPLYTAKAVFTVVGIACIVGFILNILTSAIPPDPMALEWRVGLMEQVSGRGILLFLGTGLILYGSLEQRSLARILALVCLIGGVLFLLSGVLVIRDALTLQNQALGNIDSQLEQLQSQIQSADLPPEITQSRLDEELVQIEAQASDFKQTARSTTTKSMVSVLGSQIVLGLGFLSLGRFGTKATRST